MLQLLPRSGRLVALLLLAGCAHAETSDPEWEAWERALTEEAKATRFNDAPLAEPITAPAWFRLTFLDLADDLREAIDDGKRGLVLYFGQKYCPYCRALLEDLERTDIGQYTRQHFDVLAVDVQGDRNVTDFQGNLLSEKAFAEREKTHFTPSLIFYAPDASEALRLRGYHDPYRLRAALEFVADAHYRKESFRDYLQRADPRLSPRQGALTRAPFFESPPYNLDRSRFAGERPLVVFFEQADCHACDVLHTGPLQEPGLRELLREFDSVQLGIWDDTPVVTPSGEAITAARWAEKLELFYTPTLLFFDRSGEEILRVDSVAHFYRLRSTLRYVLSGAHEKGVTLQRWQRRR